MSKIKLKIVNFSISIGPNPGEINVNNAWIV